MDNYEYIIASLPDISEGWSPDSDEDRMEELLGFIRENCSKADNTLIDSLLAGFDEGKLDLAFYQGALKSRDRFIREYFNFDLRVRNAKVIYLNKALGRPEKQDIFLEPEGEFSEKERLEAILGCGDILKRERGIDAMTDEKIRELTVFDYFDVDAVLGFIARFRIVQRWLCLDEEEGRKLFRKLVEDVRGSYEGVHYDEK